MKKMQISNIASARINDIRTVNCIMLRRLRVEHRASLIYLAIKMKMRMRVKRKKKMLCCMF